MGSGFTARDYAIYAERLKRGKAKVDPLDRIRAKVDNKIDYFKKMLFNIRLHNNRNATIVALTKEIEKSVSSQNAKFQDLFINKMDVYNKSDLIKEFEKTDKNLERLINLFHFKEDLYNLTEGFTIFKSPSKVDCVFNPAFCTPKEIFLPKSKLTWFTPREGSKQKSPAPLITSFHRLNNWNEVEYHVARTTPVDIPRKKFKAQKALIYDLKDYMEDLQSVLQCGIHSKRHFADFNEMKNYVKDLLKMEKGFQNFIYGVNEAIDFLSNKKPKYKKLYKDRGEDYINFILSKINNN